MRVLIVVRTMEERVRLLSESMQHAMDWRVDNADEALTYLRTNPDAVVVSTAAIARTGYTVPPDTLILVGPGIEGAELVQIRARARRADIAFGQGVLYQRAVPAYDDLANEDD